MHIAPQFINLDFLRTRATRQTLEVLASETMLCFECGDKLQEKDGELVCKGCGLVWGNGVLENDYVPFEVKDGGSYEGHWSPPNQLSFNKEMGVNQFLSQGSFCRIIVPANKKDLGLRARYLKMLTTKVEHPWVVAMLETGRQICEHFDLHKKNNACIRLGLS